MKIVNLTPHDIHILNNTDAVVRSISASGQVARLKVVDAASADVDGIPTTTRKVASVDLPLLVGVDAIIVSAQTADAIVAARQKYRWACMDAADVGFDLPNLSDFLNGLPDRLPTVLTVGAVVRDADGRPLGVRNLVVN